MQVHDWLTIIAILFAPLTALVIQGNLQERKEAIDRRLNIFKTLMATRATILSLEHVRALNMIDIEFYGNKKYNSVRKSWRSYLNARTNQSAANDEITKQQLLRVCEEKLTDLLLTMGNSLKYDFDESHIQKSIYKPQAHVTEEAYQIFMRDKLIMLFSGASPLPVKIILPETEQKNLDLPDSIKK